VSKSSTIIVDLSLSSFSSISFCSMNFEVLLLDSYPFRIMVFPW
jgi:hypothetical protein